MNHSKKVRVEDLVGSSEIARRLGLRNVHTVHVWRTRHSDFPQPIAKLETALIWNWQDVLAWSRTREASK